ncbi:MAG: acylphosphatase [Bacteroidota bacterium]|nr:acylphosphatase [Bacteroidota bacterium]
MKLFIIRVTGRVQNVGFRYATKAAAEKLNIRGFVQNLPDRSVYIEAEGEEPEISKFLLWCHQGPSWAHVDNISTQKAPLQHFKSFKVR